METQAAGDILRNRGTSIKRACQEDLAAIQRDVQRREKQSFSDNYIRMTWSSLLRVPEVSLGPRTTSRQREPTTTSSRSSNKLNPAVRYSSAKFSENPDAIWQEHTCFFLPSKPYGTQSSGEASVARDRRLTSKFRQTLFRCRGQFDPHRVVSTRARHCCSFAPSPFRWIPFPPTKT